MTEESKSWYALYTKPRWEKKIDIQLKKKGIDSWCPLQKVERQWTDRKKIIEEPLFKSYVFVNINYLADRTQVMMTDGVLNFVYYLGKPAVIRDEEVANIKSYLNEKDAKIQIISAQGFSLNSKVRVSQGVFMDKEGTIKRGNNNRVYVELVSLGQIMLVEFSKEHLLLV